MDSAPKPFFIAYLAILVWAPLPFGSNRTWAFLVLCLAVFGVALALVSCQAGESRRQRFWQPLRHHRLVVCLFAGIPIWVSVQSLALPSSWVEWLSPRAAGLWLASGQLDAFSISLHPEQTRRMALLSWALWVYFVLTLLLVNSMTRLRQLLGVILLSGVFQALFASFMTLSQLELGFFMEKTTGRGVATGTFINRNHLAGFLELSLAAGVGLLVSSLRDSATLSWRGRLVNLLDDLLSPKVRVRVYLAIMVIALILTRSRTGNTAFFLSLTGCGLLMLILQKRSTIGALALFGSLLVIDVLILGQWFGFEQVVERLEQTSLSRETRDEVVRDSLPLLRDYALTGTGAGTYAVTFPAYRSSDVNSFYDHAHNDYVELTATLGTIGALNLGALVVYCLLRSVRSLYRRRTALARGAAFASTMAIVSLGIHSTTDFNLQIPANALMMVVLLAVGQLAATLKGHSPSPAADAPPRRRRSARGAVDGRRVTGAPRSRH